MNSSRIRDVRQLIALLDEMRSQSTASQIGRLEKIRQSLELDEMYYEQKGNEAGKARTANCLARVSDRLSELQRTGN